MTLKEHKRTKRTKSFKTVIKSKYNILYTYLYYIDIAMKKKKN